ncbi:MAG: hypothetical protein KC777_05800 [Cyanobacteria bacterium HKST-UBA02]|nr:hypothetical protein [Cyanobacteria bacterium HKST-UBA02]
MNTRTIREKGCYKHGFENRTAIVRISGKDSRRFLQSQVTSDISRLEPGGSQLSALVSRKAHVVSVFHIYLDPDADEKEPSYYLLAPGAAPIIEHLERFIFNDRVAIEEITGSFSAHLLEGRQSRLILLTGLDQPDARLFSQDIWKGRLFEKEVTVFSVSNTGEEGFLICSARGSAEPRKAIEKEVSRRGLVELDDDLARTARIEAGIAVFGVDFDQDNLIAETPYAETAVSYEKGCFQGQEVLARIRSQGAPSRALVGAEIEPAPGSELTPGSPVLRDTEKIGYIRSNCPSEFLGRYLALVMIKRDYRTPDRELEVTIDGNQARLTVRLLPFYERPDLGEQARSLYEEALQEYAREPAELSVEGSRSIALLRQSLVLDPVFEDALEALGVILSKRSSLDEAIETMELLRRLNPNSAMAHTNLSVFWLEKGDKEKAEEHKAESMSIRMREAARLAMEEKKRDDETKARREETVSRMKMFEQVLEIDSQDLLANYGMGSCLLDLDEAERALDYLRRAIEIKPSHTVAYLDLGRALLALDKRKDAADAWSLGVEVAARRGDMEPLKKMQAHLASVES